MAIRLKMNHGLCVLVGDKDCTQHLFVRIVNHGSLRLYLHSLGETDPDRGGNQGIFTQGKPAGEFRLRTTQNRLQLPPSTIPERQDGEIAEIAIVYDLGYSHRSTVAVNQNQQPVKSLAVTHLVKIASSSYRARGIVPAFRKLDQVGHLRIDVAMRENKLPYRKQIALVKQGNLITDIILGRKTQLTGCHLLPYKVTAQLRVIVNVVHIGGTMTAEAEAAIEHLIHFAIQPRWIEILIEIGVRLEGHKWIGKPGIAPNA